MDGQPPFEMSEEQILATFNRSDEEMRYYRNHEWQVTNYAVIAYAALISAPLLVEVGRWRSWVSWVALALVWGVFAQSWRTLVYSNLVRDLEHRRLVEAIENLRWMTWIEVRHPPRSRSDRPLVVRMPERPRFPWGLSVVLLVGALFASLIIVSRIPCMQQLVGGITQSAPDLPDQALLPV